MTDTKPTTDGMRSFSAQVIADNSRKWYGNALRFPNKEEAHTYVLDLQARWILVTDTRVVESPDEPNYRYVEHKLIQIKKAA